MISTSIYNYDGLGNLTSDLRSDVSAIAYNDFHNLPTKMVKANNDEFSYRYDVSGNRSVKILNPTDTEYYLEGIVVDQNDKPKQYSITEGFATLDVSNVSQKNYNITDWLGNVRLVINASGNIENVRDHFPYSKLMDGRVYQNNTEGARYQFTGHEFDGETMFGYHGARYYNRELGRYMSMDPLQVNFTAYTPYNYTLGNPIMLIDPTGMAATPPDWVEDASGNVTWKDDVTSKDDKDLKKGETYRGEEYRRFENIDQNSYSDVRYNKDKTKSSSRRARPDADGVVTQEESLDWYHFAGGVDLTVDIGQFDFMSSSLSIQDFKTNSLSVDFFNGWSNHPFNPRISWRPAKDETLSDVYGTIRLAIVNRSLGQVRVVTDGNGFFDTFNFSSLGAIVGDRLRSNGNPTEYNFIGTGTGTIRLTSPPKYEIKFPTGQKW